MKNVLFRPTAHLSGWLAYATQAEDRGLQIIIAGAGGAAHLPGMVAAQTLLPVIGVPVKTSALGGQDSLLSIVQCRVAFRFVQWPLEAQAHTMPGCLLRKFSQIMIRNFASV